MSGEPGLRRSDGDLLKSWVDRAQAAEAKAEAYKRELTELRARIYELVKPPPEKILGDRSEDIW